MTQPNVPALRKVVEWAESEAEKPIERCNWQQVSWQVGGTQRAYIMLLSHFNLLPGSTNWKEKMAELQDCGTAYCIAGYAVAQLAGMHIDGVRVRETDEHVAVAAARILGIDPPLDRHAPESGHLFHSANKIEHVRSIAENLAGERL